MRAAVRAQELRLRPPSPLYLRFVRHEGLRAVRRAALVVNAFGGEILDAEFSEQAHIS